MLLAERERVIDELLGQPINASAPGVTPRRPHGGALTSGASLDESPSVMAAMSLRSLSMSAPLRGRPHGSRLTLRCVRPWRRATRLVGGRRNQAHDA